MEQQNGNPRSDSVPPPPQEISSSSNNHPYSSRKDRSLSPRAGYRRSYSPRRRSPSPTRGYRNGRKTDIGKIVIPEKTDTIVDTVVEVVVIEKKEVIVIILRMLPKEEDLQEGTNQLIVVQTKKDLRCLSGMGRLRKVTVQIDHYTGRNKGFAFVEFEDRRDAEDAFDNTMVPMLKGRRLKLDWDIGLGKKINIVEKICRSADPYGRGASPLGLRAFSPNYRTGGRSPSPSYRR
ncbi:unnamed protein product [Rhizophagus irregularis]|nr:unnamed protein product [Rhizophagus irregularis]